MFRISGVCVSMSGFGPTDGPIGPTSNRIFVAEMVQNTHEQSLSKGKTMNSHNTKPESIVRKESARVNKSSLVEVDKLSISEDFDQGSDPYNSTGQHVVIKSNIDLQD